MTRPLTFGSMFAGVGGFDIGMERADYECQFQIEWDKQCQSVLTRDWPAVRKWGDISKVNGKDLPPVDVIVWGSPCQDLSVAGKRAGLDGGRSGLFFEGIRVIKEMKEASSGQYPRVSIWENVVGALNSNDGADFGVILDEMAEIGALVVEWAVLDAQHFGVPQRRRRVFVVAIFDSATAGECPNPLLPVSEGLPRYLTESKPPRQNTPTEIAGCLGSGGDGGVPSSRGEHLVVGPITTGMASPRGTETTDSHHLVVEAFAKARRAHFDGDFEGSNTLAVEGFTSSSYAGYSEGVGTLRSAGGDLGGGSETLLIDGRRTVEAAGFKPNNSAEARSIGFQEGLSPTLSGAEGGNKASVLTPDMVVRRLTPLECTRLMGWSDDHLEIGTFDAENEEYARQVVWHLWKVIQSSEIQRSHTRFWGVLTPEVLLSAVRIGRFDWGLAAKCAETARLVQGEDAWPESFMHGLRSYTQHRPSPYRREPFEQLAKQLGRSLSFLPHETTPPDSAMFYLAVYESVQGTGLLREAFAALAEMGRPFVYQSQPVRPQSDSHRYKQIGNGVASPVAQWVGGHIARALRAADKIR